MENLEQLINERIESTKKSLDQYEIPAEYRKDKEDRLKILSLLRDALFDW